MEQHWFIQGKTIQRLDVHVTVFVISGVCKQLPGVSLASGDISDEGFHFLRNYLLESAYTTKEVYNVSHENFSEFFFFFIIVLSPDDNTG